jgi:hypothetical protein
VIWSTSKLKIQNLKCCKIQNFQPQTWCPEWKILYHETSLILVFGIEPGAPCTLSMYLTIEPYPQPHKMKLCFIHKIIIYYTTRAVSIRYTWNIKECVVFKLGSHPQDSSFYIQIFQEFEVQNTSSPKYFRQWIFDLYFLSFPNQKYPFLEFSVYLFMHIFVVICVRLKYVTLILVFQKYI